MSSDFFLNVIVPKFLGKTFIEKLKPQIFILCPEKVKEKLGDFWDEDFAAYITQNVMYLTITEMTLQVGKNKPHSHRMLHSAWEED